MIFVKDLTEKQTEFLNDLVVDSHFEPFTLSEKIQNIKDEFEEEFKQDLKLEIEDLEDFFDKLQLRYCENCGVVEEFDNGGGTISELDCCAECYNQIADELEEDEEDIDTLIYSRTTVSADIFYCTACKRESIEIINIESKNMQ
jgi:hypothetical protein